MTLEQQLEKGLQQLGCHVEIDKLVTYLHLLHKWNQAYNLTAVRNIDEMASRHILDSLAIMPWVQGTRVLDVGSGPGFPGVPLALARPDWQLVLLDSNRKKTGFLNEAKRTLSLSNVNIIHGRVEDYCPSGGFDTITSRAFSELQQMIKWTRHLIAEEGIWLAMKGLVPASELAPLSLPYEIKTYRVPGVEGERCCIILREKESE